MIDFTSPWVLALAPLPLLVYWLAPVVKARQSAALIVPFYQQLTAEGVQGSQTAGSRFSYTLAILAWLALLVSAADPRWHGEPVAMPVEGRNLMMAVDLSASMQERDFQFNGQLIERLTATKVVAGDFIVQRQGDRLGLILFADQAYTQTPLTFDTHTVGKLLDEAVLGLAGKNTAIGDAIALAVKKVQQSQSQDNVLILLTDGENTAGDIEPEKAAELAAQAGLKIYTIGIGSVSPQGGLLAGFATASPLDEQSLKQIAAQTGGQYFRATNLAELSQIYQLLDQLEPVDQEAQYFRPQVSLYFWPLLVGTLLLTLLALLVATKRS